MSDDYPSVPEQRRFTIGEVANLVRRQPHTLRYWEREVPTLAVIERRNGRRYYAREQVLMMQQIARGLDEGLGLAEAWHRLQNSPNEARPVANDWLRRELQKVLDIL